MISDSFEIPMPFTNRFARKNELRLTFKFEVDVRVAVPGAVECVAPVHASIFESWIFDSQREQKSIFLPLFALLQGRSSKLRKFYLPLCAPK